MFRSHAPETILFEKQAKSLIYSLFCRSFLRYLAKRKFLLGVKTFVPFNNELKDLLRLHLLDIFLTRSFLFLIILSSLITGVNLNSTQCLN